MPRRRTRGGDVIERGYRRAVEQTPDSGEEEGEEGGEERTGGIEDLIPTTDDGVRQQVLAGSRASLSIAEEFNPGFVDTEVVNRMGLVLSLNLSYDYQAGQWVAEPVDETEKRAVTQELAEDKATENLGDVVDPGGGTTIDDDGNLALPDPSASRDDWSESADTFSFTADQPSGVVVQFSTSASSITVTEVQGLSNVTTVYLHNDDTGALLQEMAISGQEITINHGFTPGVNYRITVDRNGAYYQGIRYNLAQWPYSVGNVTMVEGVKETSRVPAVCQFSSINASESSDSGTATTSFDNPCTASGIKSAQHNVCSRTKDVRVDLWHREPHGPDSTLLAKDIDEREDLSDIPPSLANLQYEITLRRGPDGESPKIERLGHQIIK